MKQLLFYTFIITSVIVSAKELTYKVEAGDQLGTVFLSLGHLKLWDQPGKINQFKKSTPQMNELLKPGTILKIQESDVLFKNNVLLQRDEITFKKKIKTKKDFFEMQNDNQAQADLRVQPETKMSPASDVLIINPPIKNSPQTKKNDEPLETEKIQSLNLYVGAGGFITSDTENDRTVSTQTMTGLQPLIQIKAIYSHSGFGSVAADFLTKQIISDQFTFPMNFDYRAQYLPKWNISDSFKIALSHSVLQHSYIGKNTNSEIAYELKTNFIGAGFVIPSEDFWFELYVEKAYSGDTKSTERTQDASSGLRLDTELVYSFDNAWTVIPGINYYQLSDTKTDYKVSASEFRMTIAREFEF